MAAVPTNSPFASCLSYIQRLEPLIEREIYESEDALQGNGIGLTVHPYCIQTPLGLVEGSIEEYFAGLERGVELPGI